MTRNGMPRNVELDPEMFNRMRRTMNRRLSWLLPLGILTVIGISSFKVIPAGQVGVVFNSLSGVKQEALQEGLHFLTPLVDHLNTYDARLQQVTLAHGENHQGDAEGAIRARSKEGLDITADVTVQFHIDKQKAPTLHKELGRNYIQTVIRPQIRSKVRDAIGQYAAAELISSQRQEVERSITSQLEQVFTKNYLVLDSVLLRELRIPDSVAQAIEQKQAAEQQVAVEKNKLQQAQVSAQRAVVDAEGKSKARIAEARGEAEALSLRGKALRDNPQLIQLTYAEKLAPNVQVMMLPQGSTPIFNMNQPSVAAATQAAGQDTNQNQQKP